MYSFANFLRTKIEGENVKEKKKNLQNGPKERPKT
jgi:hypothetical protein